MEKKRTQFSSKIGFILAAAGSAVGLGNIWRFPYLAAEYGGGIFLFTYIILAITFGFCLTVTEIAIGRKTGTSFLNAYKKLDKRFAFIGIITLFIPILILPYYSVIGGWVVHFAYMFISGQGMQTANPDYFAGFISQPGWPILFLAIFLGLTAIIVMLGVKRGIELTCKIFMPMLVLMTVGLAIYIMTLPGAMEGVKHYLIPNFSDFSFETVLAALGQLFYSMSLAMGIMFTYGSYLNKKENLEASVRHIELFDTGIAFLSGLMILPAVFVFSGGDAAFAQLIRQIFLLEMLSNIFLAVHAAIMALLYAFGYTKLSFGINFARLFIFRLPILFALKQFTALSGGTAMGIVMMVSNGLTGLFALLVAMVVLRKEYGSGWIKLLLH